MILCVAGNPSIDKLFEIDRIELGSLHRPSHFVQVPGGKGLNVARAASSLGAPVMVTGVLAGHAGRWIDDELTAEGVGHRFVWAESGETRSSLSVAESDHAHLTEFYEAGTPLTGEDWGALETTVGELLSRASWIAISGSLPPGAPDEGYVGLVPLTRTALDSRAAGIDARPAVVKLNESEAGVGAGGAVAAARQLHERSGGAAIVTRGRAGAVLVTPDGAAMTGRLDADGAYPVGSGDAFLAGLVVALDGGADWPEALRAGLGAGAANAAIPGAGRLDRATAERLAGEAGITPE